jgi:DNA gyrase subunit A
MGKRTNVDAYRLQKRGGTGVINLKTSDRTGQVVAIMAVQEDEQLMVITKAGVVNRQRVAEISLIGRATQGVKLVNLDEGDIVVDVARVVIEEENGENGEAEVTTEAGPEGETETDAHAGTDADAEPDAGTDVEGGTSDEVETDE